MSALKQAHPARAALTKAIENRVERMDMAALLELAATLSIPVPPSARIARGSNRKPMARPSRPAAKVLKGSGVGAVVTAAEGSRLLDAITVDEEAADWAESDLVGAGELAKKLRISRGTLDNWRKANKVVALRKGLRNFVYPLRQFERRGPVEGLDVVTPFFASHEEAWEWLVAPNRMTGGQPPIDRLRDGAVSVVKSAAEGLQDYA